MGKHSKKAQNKNVHGTAKRVPIQVKSQTNILVQKLLTKCSNSGPLTRKTEWDDHKGIRAIVEEIRKLESDYVASLPKREDNWEAFITWCKQNGMDFDGIKIKEISEGNYGLFTEKNIQEDELFLKVPRKLMMTLDSATQSRLAPLIRQDPILQHMSNVVLSLHLLMEFLNPNSFWQPYISVLPSKFDTFLYFDVEELQELQASPAQDEVLKIYRSVARQYAYFHQLFQSDSYGRTLDIGYYFTYDMYRWAVSAIMTRQNAVPSPDGVSKIVALIPFWDMCNHSNGKFSTDYNLKQDCILSYAMKDYSPGDEVHMFYGPRSNADFFAHNGFIYADNEHDSLTLKFGISRSDPLCGMKTALCSKIGISLNGTFYLEKEPIINDELLNFVKINVMKEDELRQELEGNTILNEDDSDKSKDLRRRALYFMKDRTFLLLKSYKTTLEDDEALLPSITNPHLIKIMQLRILEKKTLKDAFNYCLEGIK